MKQVIIDTGIDVAENYEQLKAPFFARATAVPSRNGCWDVNEVEVIERATDKVLGFYRYRYSHPGRTFHPFKLRGEWYALYSMDYTATRIMSLPDCKDLGGEEGSNNGFCPVDYWVPAPGYLKFVHLDNCPRNTDFTKQCICKPQHRKLCPLKSDNPPRISGGYDWSQCLCKEDFAKFNEEHYRHHSLERIHGFVAGCFWGDDSSWKIQYLDLSRADEGILKRDDRFGYIELPANLTLDKAVDLLVDDDGEIYRASFSIVKHFRMDGNTIEE